MTPDKTRLGIPVVQHKDWRFIRPSVGEDIRVCMMDRYCRATSDFHKAVGEVIRFAIVTLQLIVSKVLVEWCVVGWRGDIHVDRLVSWSFIREADTGERGDQR